MLSKSVHRKPGSTPNGSSLSDTPTTVDLLGYRHVVGPISTRILNSDLDATPLTIGIYGEWGSGKTSFLMMLDDNLKSKGLYPIWFNAWKYDREDNLWSALLQTVLDQARISGGWWRRLHVRAKLWWNGISIRAGTWEVVRRLGATALRILLFVLALYYLVSLPTYLAVALKQVHSLQELFPNGPPASLTALGRLLLGAVLVFAAKPEALLKLFDSRLGIDFGQFSRKRTYLERIAFLDEFTAELQRVVHLVSPKYPLVVMIDDLDRCLPEKALHVLEAMKLFLDVKGCIFILAADKEIVENAIQTKLKEYQLPVDRKFADSKQTFGQAYFEKLVHLPFSLPPHPWRPSSHWPARFALTMKLASVQSSLPLEYGRILEH
jgi:hypothetical protein